MANGDDYTKDDLYAAVAHMTLIRILASYCTTLDMEIESFDVATAFIFTQALRTVYVHQPEGFHHSTNRVYLETGSPREGAQSAAPTIRSYYVHVTLKAYCTYVPR